MKLRLPPGQLHGNNVRTHQFGSIRVTDTLHPSGLKTQKHSHELSLFCFVREGTFSEVYGRRQRECKPLNIIYRPSDELHADRFHNAGARCLTVEIKPDLLERVREYAMIPDDSKDFYAGKTAWLAAKLYSEFVLMDAAAPLAVEGLTLELMAEASRAQVKAMERKPPRWLEHARELLHAHFSDPLTVDGIAKTVGTHPVHLARTFRRTYCCTIGEYVRQLRIDFACSAIADSNDSLAEIAASSGFYDQSHFSRLFKQKTGITPSEYRTAFRSR